MKNAENKIKELRKKIRRHNYLYYVKNKPKISDEEYDKLVKKLKELEKENPELVTSDSPTQRVGAEPAEEFEEAKHVKPMLSLDTADRKGISKFDERNKKNLKKEEIDYVLEPKIDGLSVELIYEDGVYKRGSTRGNGQVGENVTENIKTIKAVPLKLLSENKKIPKRLAVRGEVIMFIEDFKKYNKKIIEEGKKPMANPRNAAAGSLRRLNPKETAERPLSIFFYEIMNYDEKDINVQNHWEALELLNELGLKTNKETKKVKKIKEAVDYHKKMERKREKLGYEIDGIVIKVNKLKYQDMLGVKSNSPRWAIAYKFSPRKEETQVLDIVVQVGRRGTLTPVALLKPVDVQGVTVSRATLHNEDYIREKDIKIKDWVKVVRAGDVIPEVSDVNKKKRTGKEKKFTMPKKCPVCGTKVVKEGSYYRCSNGLACEAQLKRSIEHFASKDAMDIDGLGEKIANVLVDKKIVKRISDIYKIEKDDLTSLEKMGEKSSQKLIDSINDSKNRELSRFIYGLGIPEVGKHVAKILVEKFKTVNKIKNAKKEELLEIEEIGPEIAQNMENFFEEKKNRKEIEELKKLGIKMAPQRRGGKLEGKRFVFTGALEEYTRSEAKNAVEREGGEAISNVSKKVDYVVVGESPGSKLDEAKELGIKIIKEKKFKEILNN